VSTQKLCFGADVVFINENNFMLDPRTPNNDDELLDDDEDLDETDDLDDDDDLDDEPSDIVLGDEGLVGKDVVADDDIEPDEDDLELDEEENVLDDEDDEDDEIV
jgi:DNA-directed RNA polymerase subunit delta